MESDRPAITIIGLGRVGSVLYGQLRAAGYAVIVSSLRAPKLSDPRYFPPEQAIQRTELLLLSVPDDAIASSTARLADFDLTGKAVVHLSGALGSDVLQMLTACGAEIGSLHPAYPFAGIERLPAGVAFAIETSHERLRGWLHQMVQTLDGLVVDLPTGKKAQYHSALVFASNYVVTLYAVAQGLLAELDVSHEASKAVLNTLITGTVENLQLLGVPAALTGPLVRGDVGTIQAHLATLNGDTHDLYKQLAWMTLPLVRAQGVDASIIEQILKQA